MTAGRFPIVQRAFLFFALLMALLLIVPGGASADGNHKPPPISMVLYIESQGLADEPAPPLLDLRDRLRSNDRLEVLVFEPDSPTFVLAARSANPPIDLNSVKNFDTRVALAQAAGAQFALMAAPTDIGSDHMDLRLFEIAPISRSWTFTNQKAKDAAKAVAEQVISAATEKPPATPPPASVPSGSSAGAPPAIVTTAPPPVVSAPSPVAIPPSVVPPAESTPKQETPANQPPPSAPTASPKVNQNANIPAKINAPVVPLPQRQPDQALAAPPPSVQTAPVISAPPAQQAPLINAPPTQNKPQEQAALIPTPTPPLTSTTPANPGQAASPTAAGETPAQGGPSSATSAPVDQPLATESPVAAPPTGPELNDDARGKMAEGDTALQESDVYSAIEFYREAVNEAPRATEPRMRLIQAYLQAGLKDQALDEERRALMVDPDNTDVQNLLKSQTADGSLPGSDLAIRQAAVGRDPSDEPAWIALGDSYWNSGQPDQALQAYEKAARLKPGDVAAEAHLARLYAATSQYQKSLDALTKAGPGGYPYALRIIAARTDNLIADIESAHEVFDKGDSTREQFYDSLKIADNQSQALAQFVGKIDPPADYNVAYLHRRLATNLLAQATAAWLSFIETNDGQYSSQATLLQSEASQEMKTASIAERLQSSLSAVAH